MYPDDLIVWFFSDWMIEILMCTEIEDDRIREFLVELLNQGEIKFIIDRNAKGSQHAAYAVMLWRERSDRKAIQYKICEFLRSLGEYNVIKEELDT